MVGGRATSLVSVLIAVGVVAGLWATIVTELERDRQKTQLAAETSAANLARAFEEHVVRTVAHIDTLLLQTRKEIAEHDILSRPDRLSDPASAFARHLMGEVVFGPLAQQVGIIDASGWLSFSSLGQSAARVDLSDREHFTVHRDSNEDRLFISKPIVGRVSNKASIQFTRRLTKPDGSFGGVIVVSAAPSYFSDFYASVGLGKDGAVTLLGTDGVVRARGTSSLEAPQAVGVRAPADRPFMNPASPPAGIYEATSAIDGKVRIGAYRRLADYPLVVVVLLSKQDIFAAFEHRRELLYRGGAILTVLVIAGLIVIVLQQVRQRRYRQSLEEANARLRVSEARHRYLASTDMLTGIPNRRIFLERADDEFVRAKRYGRPLSVIMLDIDRFKGINDAYGHAIGDAVLRAVAQRCVASLREQDGIGRLGGEEFGVLLPETDLSAALEVAERLREEVAGAPITVDGRLALTVTASFGVAAADDEATFAELLCRADQVLYQAKDAGRNRVVAASTATPAA